MTEPTTTELAANTLRALDALMADAPQDTRDAIVRYRAELDGYIIQLREGGWTQGQIGALVFDGMLRKGVDHDLAVVLVMEALK